MKLLFLIITMMSSLGWSAQTLSESRGINTTEKTVKKSKLKKSFYQVHMQYLLWQEDIDANAGTLAGSIPFQFTGLKMGASYNSPLSKIRWVQSYAMDVSFGTAKGGSSPNALTDEFKNQMWYAATLTPGLTYRSSAVSELSLILPLTYRKVNWSYGDSLAIELDRSSSFSVGLGALFALRFTPKSALFASLTHQQMWKTTQWSIGWQYAFK